MARSRGDWPEETWDLIRKDYEAGVSGLALHKKYGPARQSIEYRAEKQGWSRDPLLQEAVAATAAATAKSKSKKSATSRSVLISAAESLKESAQAAAAENPVERIARDRLEVIEAHQDKWHTIDEIYEDAMRLLRGEDTKVLVRPKTIYAEDGTTILEKAEVLTLTKRINLAAKLIAVYEGASRGLMTKQEGERRAYGFDYKTQLEEKGVDEQAVRRRRELAGSVIGMVSEMKSTIVELQTKLAEANAGAPPQTPPTIDGVANPPQA